MGVQLNSIDLTQVNTDVKQLNDKTQYQTIRQVYNDIPVYEQTTNTLSYIPYEQTFGLRFRAKKNTTLKYVLVESRYIPLSLNTTRRVVLWNDNLEMMIDTNLNLLKTYDGNYRLELNKSICFYW